MIRAVAFDFDGVIVESVDLKTQAFARMFADAGPEIVDKVVSYHLEHGGLSRVEKFRHFYKHYLHRPLSDSELKALCDRFRTLVFDGVVAVPWVTGAIEAVKCFHETGLLQFVVSGTPQDELGEIVRRRGIEHFFAGVFGSPRLKGDLLRSILTAHGLAASEVLFVGDATTDYDGARMSGVQFVARSTPPAVAEWRDLGVPCLTDLTALPTLIADLATSSSRTASQT